MVFEIIRRQPVGHVQRKIPDAAAVGEKFQVIVIADQIAVGVAGAHLVQNPFLAHFENARRRDPDAGLRECGLAAGADNRRRVWTHRDRFAIFLRVFKFAINRLHAALQRGFELRQIADEDDQFRSSGFAT